LIFDHLIIFRQAHGTDILNVYGGGDMANYLIRFAAKLDPNGGSDINWPKYTTSSPKMLLFQDNLFFPQDITTDNYRVDAMNLLTNFTYANPL
jgi:acetylcholinesterase